MPKIVGGGYSALTGASSQTDDVMVIVDIHDTTEDSTGTTKTITLANLAEGLDSDTDTDIQAPGAQSAGAGTLVANSQHVHPAGSWIPSDNGLLAANFPPWGAGANTTAVASSLYLLKIWIRQPFTATNLLIDVQAGGTGASTQSFCGLWSSAGTLLTGSSDIGSSVTSTGVKTLAFTTAQSLTVSMGFVWAGFVFNLATTQPSLRNSTGGALNSALAANFNLSAAQFAAAINGTAITALANITPSANTQSANSVNYWVGIT